MCYRCYFCDAVSPPGQPLLKHTRYREVPKKQKFRKVITGQDSRGRDLVRYVEDGDSNQGRDIVSEVSVCKECCNALSLGLTEEDLVRQLAMKKRRQGIIPFTRKTSARLG